jgi:hypothetical protein
VPRLVLVAAALLGSVASAQSFTVNYLVPIQARTTPALTGVGAVDVALWYSDPATPVAGSLLFATSNDVPFPFTLGTYSSATVTGFPSSAAGVASGPNVIVQGTRRSLVAVAVAGSVRVGIIDDGQWSALATTQSISGGPPMAVASSPDGGAVLLVSDATATQLTRYDLGLSSVPVGVVQGKTASLLTEPIRALVLDGARNKVLAGGGTLGNLYVLDARLDAGPDPFDIAQTSQGRLIPPVTGLAVYQGTTAAYLLVSSNAGLTIYDLRQSNPLPGAFTVTAQDSLGPLTGPTGVAVTNMAAGTSFPEGVIALGDPTNRGIALVRWDAIPPDAGLVSDPSADPRGLPLDGGPGDSGCPTCGPGGGGNGQPGGPPGPGIPVDHGSSCASAAGAPLLVLLLASLGLLPRRRQRR